MGEWINHAGFYGFCVKIKCLVKVALRYCTEGISRKNIYEKGDKIWKKVLVFGHKNLIQTQICSAIAYAS